MCYYLVEGERYEDEDDAADYVLENVDSGYYDEEPERSLFVLRG